jgi:hypothetical protein
MSKDKSIGYAVFVIHSGCFLDDKIKVRSEEDAKAEALRIITELRDENITKYGERWQSDENESFEERKECIEQLQSCELSDEDTLVITAVVRCK